MDRDLPKRPSYMRKRNLKERSTKEIYIYGKRLTNWQIMRSTQTKASTRKETYK